MEDQLFSKSSESRRKLISQLAEEEMRLNSELSALQKKRDEDRERFISVLQSEENKADESVVEMLSKRKALKCEHELDFETSMKLFDQPDGNFLLRRDEVLASMRTMLECTEGAYLDYQKQRQTLFQRILVDEPKSASALDQAISDHYQTKLKLFNEQALASDSQEAAFARLLAERDARTMRLRQDIVLVEQQLCCLTAAEQKRRTEREEVSQRCLLERRRDLVDLLTHLRKQQEQRSTELRLRVEEMENRFSQDQRDYWLIQYQRLMDRKPPDLGPMIEPEVHKLLANCDALQFLPNFQYHNIDFAALVSMTDADLEKIGVYSLGVRRSIIQAAKAKVMKPHASDEKNRQVPAPSAPPVPSELDSSRQPHPSAPPADVVAWFESECCVCQNAKCSVIFLQCGHVCTCAVCSQHLSVCPLCRAPIVQRIKMQH